MTWSIKNVTCLSQPVSAIYKVKSGRYFGHWISAMAQRVKTPPAMQGTRETRVKNILWWRKWPTAPVFLPGEFHKQRSKQTQSQTWLSDWASHVAMTEPNVNVYSTSGCETLMNSHFSQIQIHCILILHLLTTHRHCYTVYFIFTRGR